MQLLVAHARRSTAAQQHSRQHVINPATVCAPSYGSCRSGKIGIPATLDYKLCFLALSAFWAVSLLVAFEALKGELS